MSEAALPSTGQVQRIRTPGMTLQALERRRGHLWVVTALFLLAASTAVVLTITDTPLLDYLPDSPFLRYGFLGISVAFIIYVFDQERAFRTLTHALVDERVLTASLEQRIADLTELSKVGRLVNSVLTIDEVLEAILDAAFVLTGASAGSVMLRDGDDLVVRVSQGEDAAPVGARTPIASGVSGWVAQNREPLLLTGLLSQDQLPGLRPRQRVTGSAVCAPLIAAGNLLGVLSLERPAEGGAFSELQSRSIALFAEHAATAVANAQRYEHERATVERLADVIDLRSEFVATLVHDLKGPLTAVIGYSNTLRKRYDSLEPHQREHAIEAIEVQGRRLFNMVGEVLRSASVEAGAELSREPVELYGLLGELRDAFIGASQGDDVRLRQIDIAGVEGPVIVYGDHEALEHVFSNLIENATKYSEPDDPIEIEVARHGGEVQVHIRDRGIGIAEEDLPYVFERFRQSGGGGTGGVGLGLYIVRTLVGAHGGKVWVTSQPGEGSTFTVALPVRGDAAASLVGQPERAQAAH